MEHRTAAVRRTLDEVGAGEVLSIDVFNKCDLLDPAERERLERREPDALCISAATVSAGRILVDAITARLGLDVRRNRGGPRPGQRGRPPAAGRDLPVRPRGRQHSEHDGEILIEADVPQRLWSRLQQGRKADHE